MTLLEIINYVEHYGLHRRKGEDGRYERTNHTHSWNSNFVFTNLVLFHLQRHSDHHAFAKRPIRSSVIMTIARRCPAVMPGWWCWR